VRIRFGEFTLDSESRQLRRGGDELRLSRKAFDLLAILLEHRPGVVDKDELRDRLWGTTNVVDANLNNLAGEIRAVLSDDAQRPRFLRTVHRVGYAFCGEAEEDRQDRPTTGGSPRFWLVWKDRTIVLTGEACVIGRDPSCDVWIDAPGVSRRHARVRMPTAGAAGGAELEDLESTNGTFVRGRRVSERTKLQDGDPIRVGEATLTFREWAADGSPTKRVGRGRGSKS
jgi:DNA-binding winged helix-turn-helix (wHTH) protein